ncbi:hypothetical protein KBX49_06740 [Liquorilactobacillus satsumensis]|uniref:hypothetical protein n=1 Tax=Liquorilactobacillus satsumensis TaxID=259059 RepID=UPI0021C41BC2|nr:hypothetical protein [Liquorilactobacillus satsumensis]MCP9357945.1 hypothetical protein [Liquorilactobacillus satsumensis]MCP9371627.1 hypothetical protein [Liquorilactobacillus satsumensis]
MTKNKLEDLNDHLFAQLERLGDEDLKGDDLQEETARAHAISDIAKNIVANADLALKASIAYDHRESADMAIPKMIGDDQVEKK